MNPDPSENNPWITRNTELVYESPWIKVFRNEVINPAGNPAIYSVVHFQNYAIGILAINCIGEISLVGQYRYPIEAYAWEIPEGGGKLGEDPLENAKRELKEETGIQAHSISEFMRLHLSNSATDELAIVYLATKLQHGTASPEESEVLNSKMIHIEEAFKMIMNGEITDAISVAAIQKAYWLFKNDSLSF